MIMQTFQSVKAAVKHTEVCIHIYTNAQQAGNSTKPKVDSHRNQTGSPALRMHGCVLLRS